MFSLSKFAYIACNRKERAWYDKLPGVADTPSIPVGMCCYKLLKMANKPYRLRPGVFEAINEACKLDHVDCLTAAHRMWQPTGCSIQGRMMFEVSLIFESTECLDYVLRNGLADFWSYGLTFTRAVVKGNLECMRIMLRHGVPWDGKELLASLMFYEVDCLRLLLENGCCMVGDEWETLENAVCKNDPECLELLRSHGMPLTANMYAKAYRVANNELLQYLVDNKCPNPNNVPTRKSPRYF